MKTRRMGLVAAIGLSTWISPAMGLDIGDVAPPLKIKEWVRGDQVNLAKDAAKKIHMVEFWATWCPPCKASVPLLTEYQNKHAKDLTIIGITDPDPRNTPTDIKQFVTGQGKGMSYTVAMDDRGATTEAYLGSGEVTGIPYAYLVGRDGRVAWHGSPLDPALEQIIPELIAGKYDINAAKAAMQLEVEIGKRFDALDRAYQLGQMGVVWDGLVDILKMDPAHDSAMQLLTGLYMSEPARASDFRQWAEGHIAAHGKNVKVMQRLAMTLLGNGDFSTRTPDLALKAAKAAYDAGEPRPAAAVEILARANFEIGGIDRAITLQQEAVSLASDGEKTSLQKVLDYYLLCKRLQTTSS